MFLCVLKLASFFIFKRFLNKAMQLLFILKVYSVTALRISDYCLTPMAKRHFSTSKAPHLRLIICRSASTVQHLRLIIHMPFNIYGSASTAQHLRLSIYGSASTGSASAAQRPQFKVHGSVFKCSWRPMISNAVLGALTDN